MRELLSPSTLRLTVQQVSDELSDRAFPGTGRTVEDVELWIERLDVKIGPGSVVLRSTKPLEGAKTMKFTADKRNPPPPEFAHHYWPGFMLPKNHQGFPAKEMAPRTPSVLGRPLPPAVRDACLQLRWWSLVRGVVIEPKL